MHFALKITKNNDRTYLWLFTCLMATNLNKNNNEDVHIQYGPNDLCDVRVKWARNYGQEAEM